MLNNKCLFTRRFNLQNIARIMFCGSVVLFLSNSPANGATQKMLANTNLTHFVSFPIKEFIQESVAKGYVRQDGSLLNFDQTSPFDSEGMALVRKGKQLGFIDRNGNFPVPLSETYLALGRFEHDLARAKAANAEEGKEWGLIDRHGKWAVPPQFAALGPVSANGLIPAAVKIGRLSEEQLPGGPNLALAWGYINRQGQWKIPPRYQRVYPFSQGGLALAVLNEYAWLKSDGGNVARWELIDETGAIRVGLVDGDQPKPLGGESLRSIGFSADGKGWKEESANPRWYAFDDGEMQRLRNQLLITSKRGVVKLVPYRAVFPGCFLKNLLFIADADSHIGLMRMDGEIVLKPRYTSIAPFGKGFIASEGDFITMPYGMTGMAIPKPKEKTRYDVLDISGKLLAEFDSKPESVILPNFDEDDPQPTLEWASFSLGEQEGLVSSKGQIISAGRYDELEWDRKSGFIRVRKGDVEGVLDDKGEPCFFLHPKDHLEDWPPAGKEHLFVFRDDATQKSGLVDRHGNILLPARFNDLKWTTLGLGIAGFYDSNEDWHRGIIDEKGDWLVKPKYSDIYQVGAFFKVSNRDKEDKYFLNAKGKEICHQNDSNSKAVDGDTTYSSCDVVDSSTDTVSLKGHFLIVEKETSLGNDSDSGKRWGLMDEEGHMVIPLSSANIGDVPDTPNLFFVGDAIVAIDANGKLHRRGSKADVADLQFAPNGLALAQSSARHDAPYGYKDHEGRWAIPPKFYDASSFFYEETSFDKERLVRVQLSPRRYDAPSVDVWIDKTGKVVVPRGIRSFLGKDGRSLGFKDLSGKVVIPPEYDSIDGFYENDYAVLTRHIGGKRHFYVINGEGKFIADFDKFDPLSTRKVILVDRIPKEIHFWVIGKNGKQVAAQKPDEDVPANSHWLVVEDKEGKKGLIDEDAKLVLPFAYENLGYPDAKGFIPARQNGKSGFVSLSGEWKIAPQFAAVKTFSANGLAPACERVKPSDKDCLWGYIDRQGQWKIPPRFEKVEGFASNGLAPVYYDNRPKKTDGEDGIVRRFINEQGKVETVTEYIYGNLPKPEEKDGNAWGLVDEQGKVVVPFIFLKLEQRGNFWVGSREFSDGKESWTTYSIIDSQGKITESDLAWVDNSSMNGNKGWTRFVLADDSRGKVMYGFDGNNGMVDDDGRVLVKPRYDLVFPHEKDGLIEIWDGGKVSFIHPDGSIAFTVKDFSYQKISLWQKLKAKAMSFLQKRANQ